MKQLKDIVLTGFLALLAFTACTEEKLIDERPMETGTVSISFSTEGVETKEEYEAVRELVMEYIQGYYFGRPMSARQFEDRLKE